MKRLSLILFSLVMLLSCSTNEAQMNVKTVLGEGIVLRGGVADGGNGTSGRFKVKPRGLQLSSDAKDIRYGVPCGTLMSGQFLAEVHSAADAGYGLAIVRMDAGRPDLENYVGVEVTTLDGFPFVKVIDCQNGKMDVLDNTGAIPAEDYDFRYTQHLDGDEFSVPYTAVNGRLKVLRNDISGFFHIYYGVSKFMNGKDREAWMELASVHDWNGEGTEFVAVPFVRADNGAVKVLFNELVTRNFSSIDRPVEEFSIARREYVWSGFNGDAIVVGFNPEYCDAATPETKFILWSEMNYVPGWSINNDMIYSYEFCETWRTYMENSGCYEPMSDRVLAYNYIRQTEDLDVRKGAHFHYALVNPDYVGPYTDGTYPEIDEFYTIYPDGIGIREINFIQSQGGKGEYRSHELAEPMVIAGSKSIPAQHTKEPGFVVSNLSGDRFEFYPDRSTFPEARETVPAWPEQIYRSRLVDSPDIFCVFSYSPDHLQTAPLPVCNDLNWHNTTYQFAHWPVDKQKYLGVRNNNYSSSRATWKSQVAHTSYIGVEAKEGTDWESDYKLDEKGRKYRTYLMMFGMLEPDDEASLNGFVSSWLFDGEITSLTGASYDCKSINYAKREIVLDMESDRCAFTMRPSRALKNPVFRLNGWGAGKQLQLNLNGRSLLEKKDYLYSFEGDDAIVWIKAGIAEDSYFVFSADDAGTANPRVSYRDWDGCIELSNSTASVIINPAYGANILSYRLNDGENMMWADSVVNGWTLKDFIPSRRSPDAGRFDIGNERRTENIHDCIWAGAYTVIEETPGHVILRSPVSREMGVYLDREFTLKENSSVLEVRQTLYNVSDDVQTYCFWTRTLLPAGGRFHCTVYGDPAQAYTRISLENDLAEACSSERVKVADSAFEAFPGGEEEFKWGIHNQDGVLSYELGGVTYTKKVEVFPGMRYENNAGLNYEAMLYFNSQFMEMEPNSPMFDIEPGKSVSVAETWSLEEIE